MASLFNFINLFGRHRYKVLMQREGENKGEIDCLCKSIENGEICIVYGYSSITNNYHHKKALGKLDSRNLRIAKQEFMYVPLN